MVQATHVCTVAYIYNKTKYKNPAFPFKF